MAGDLVFLGESNGKFNAVDSKSGAVLWSYKPTEPNSGGANGAPAVYMVGGREFVVMAFGGNTQVRSGQNSPTGDVLIAFALQQGGQNTPNIVTAQPTQLATGEIDESILTPPEKSAPSDAQVIDVHTENIHFYPDHLTAKAGQKLAVHLMNMEPGQVFHNFYIALPSGVIGTKGMLNSGQGGYLVFTAPQQPGEYYFWCDVGTHRFQGMTGELVVEPSIAEAAGPSGARSTPGMPRTESGDSWDPFVRELLLGLVAVVLLVSGVHVLRRRSV